MHSRIFQVSAEPNAELIEEYRYEDGFVGRVADYVVTSENRKDDLDWLKQATEGLEIDTDKMTIKLVSKAEYFKKNHERFTELAEKFSTMSLEDFISTKGNSDFYELKSVYEDKYGFYIDDDDDYFGIVPLDEWVRGTDEGTIVHVGSTFDYHF